MRDDRFQSTADKFVSELKDIFSASSVIFFLIGVVLVAAKDSVPVGGMLMQEIGYAMLISVFVGIVVERRHRMKWLNETSSRMEEISNNVFSGVFQAELPPDLVRETLDLGLRQKVIRNGFDVTYTIRDDTYQNAQSQSVPFVLLDAQVTFTFKNIGVDTQHVDIGVKLPDPIVPSMRNAVKIKCFEINGDSIDDIDGLPALANVNDLLQADLANHERRDGSYVPVYAQKKRPIGPGEDVHIKCDYVMAKEIEDTEFLRSLYPSDGINITVVDTHPETRIIDAHSVHGGGFDSSPEDDQSKSVYKWEINRYLLPHQGVMFWWKKVKS